MREVRLLRSAVERQTAIAVRSQVLAGRLAARLQQVSRAQDAVDRAEEALEAAVGRQEQLRGELAGLNAELAPLLQDLRRSELERAARTVEAELSLQDHEVARSRSRHQLAQDRLSAEQQRYREAETALGSLEREVAP